MSEYFGDESPWGQPLLDDTAVGSAFDAAEDEVSSPWGADTNREDSNLATVTPDVEEDFNPYGEASDPLIADNSIGVSSATAAGAAGAAAESISEHKNNHNDLESLEPVPALKNVQSKSKTNKKKRAGAIKIESGGADPLAASTVQLDNVALATHSLRGLNVEDSEIPQGEHQGEISHSSLNGEGALPSLYTAARSLSSFDPPAKAAAASNSASIPSATKTPRPASIFEIHVSDPSMVGDLTNAHTEYTVQMSTSHEQYEVKEAAVQRRYRDFRWLYRTLEHNHPGIIVPPPPGKQALGRFNDDFVQQRRAALEQMIRKITMHPALRDDPDLRAFLTSADFGEYLKSHVMTDEQLDNGTGSFLGYLDSVSSSTSSSSNGGGGSGFIGSLSGALSLSRGTEMDPWTVEKRAHLDKVEAQLREVSKELVAISLHRQQLSSTLSDFANVVRVLSDIEATRRLSTVLRAFAKVHERLAQIYERQRQQNLLTLEATLDEYLRTIGSVRDALTSRQRIFSAAEHVGSELEKRQAALDKLLRQTRTQEDRQKALEEDIEHLSKSASSLHRQAGNVAHLVESEIARVNEEHIEELRNSVEIYLENTVEAQKESIEVWETFYTRNFAS